MDWQQSSVKQSLPRTPQAAQTGSFNKVGQVTAAKPKLHCDVCKKDFSGTADRDSHMAGAKHARAVKSQKIISDLKENGKEIPAATAVNSMFRCATCDITLNSSQQLSTHLNGSRHKLKEKTTKGGSGGIVLAQREKLVPGSTGVLTTSPAAAAAVGTTPTTTASSKTTGTTATTGATTTAAGTTAANGAAAPAAATKPKSGEKAPKPPVQTFECRTCHVTLNSESQRDQHMTSKKHADRVSGVNVSHSRGIGLGFRGRGTPFSTRNARGRGGISRGRAMTPRGGRGRAAWIGGGGGYASPGGGGYGATGGGGYGATGGGGYGSAGGGGYGATGGGGYGSAGGGGYGSAGGGGYGAAGGGDYGGYGATGGGDYSDYGGQGGGEFGSQGDFGAANNGQFDAVGGGDISSPGGPVFRGRGRSQVHSSLPYSRPPPPMPPVPPSY